MRSPHVVLSTLCATAATLSMIVSSENSAFAEKPAPPTTCPAPVGGSLTLAGAAATSRLAFIRANMDDQAMRSRTWSWGWGITGAALIAESFIQAARASKTADRTDEIVGGSSSVLIPLFILFQPPRVLADHAELEAAITQSSDICATLVRAEEFLARDANDEAMATGVSAHVTGIAFNVALGLALGLGFGHWKGAASVGGGGIVISEAQVFTKPRGAIRALERYRQGDLSPLRASQRWFIAPHISPSALGAHLVIAF
jgi:hypothetical protein